MAKNVATQQAAAVPSAEVDYGKYAGAGFEGMGKDDYLVPFLRILQSNSPQVEGGASPIPGAKPGMIFNNVTKELIAGDAGVTFVPVAREHNYVEYTPRDAGGGFVGIRPVDDPLVANLLAAQGRFKKLVTKDGTELVETYYVFGVAILSDRRMPAVVGFSSTQIKAYKGWMTNADGITIKLPNGGEAKPPLFAHRWRLGTFPDKNKKGSFHSWRVALDGLSAADARLPVSDPLFQQCVQFYESAKSGKVTTAHDAGGQEAGGDEVPF